MYVKLKRIIKRTKRWLFRASGTTFENAGLSDFVAVIVVTHGQKVEGMA
jgi:hypothetical protein